MEDVHTYLDTEIVCDIMRMILKSVRDEDGGHSLLSLQECERKLLTLVVTLPTLAHTRPTVAVVGRSQLYLRTANNFQ